VRQETTDVLAERYELGPLLGQGGMARVHRGLDRQLRRPVAVKVLAPPLDRDKAFVERFRREARAAAGLSHPNIVAVFDSGSDDGTHYIVTELVDGETLAERLRRDGPMAPPEAVGVAVDVCHALAAAHERGVVHRDIKPGNVMLLPDGRVKVVDFGIARAAGSDTLTGTGVVLGSSAYLSPEQASGGSGDERSDLYALGCVLYEMLTGEVPFRADTPVATMYLHVNEDPPRPSTVRPVPAKLEDVVMRCLEKDPKRRFGSAGQLEQALLAAPLSVGGDTQPLAAVGDSAAETRPIAAVGDTAAETRPIAAMPAAVSGATGGGVQHRRKPERRVPGWAFGAAGILLFLGLAAAALAFGSDPLRPRAEARAAAREAVETALPPETSATLVAAWSDLVGAIGSAQATGRLEDEAANDLAKAAQDALEAYRDADADELANALGDLEEELAKAVEDEEVSAGPADAIDQAMFDLVLALENAGALAVVEPSPVEETDVGSADESSGEGGEGNGNAGEGNGNAYGHDKDNEGKGNGG
jgi:hypothetical protein